MHSEEKLAESQLITLLAKGSEYAFKVLYNQYSNRIYKHAQRYLKSPVLAQEIVQDVFLKLWFERTKIKADKPIEAWLITVTRNKLINQFRKLSRERIKDNCFDIAMITDKSDTEEKIISTELENQINTIINRLPQMQKQVYTFAKVEDLSYNEIAGRLKISPLTVKTHMARALVYIRKSLKQYGIATSYFILLVLN